MFLFSGRILWALGSWLVESESPRKADIVVSLAGEWTGSRVLKGAELVREGFAPKLLVSNGSLFYGHFESDFGADLAASQGYDRGAMICLRKANNSTDEEAQSVVALLHELGVHSVLLVTSPSHTARAARIFRRAAPDLEFHPIEAPDPKWCGGRWWTSRECEKTWFFEAVKALTHTFGI